MQRPRPPISGRARPDLAPGQPLIKEVTSGCAAQEEARLGWPHSILLVARGMAAPVPWLLRLLVRRPTPWTGWPHPIDMDRLAGAPSRPHARLLREPLDCPWGIPAHIQSHNMKSWTHTFPTPSPSALLGHTSWDRTPWHTSLCTGTQGPQPGGPRPQPRAPRMHFPSRTHVMTWAPSPAPSPQALGCRGLGRNPRASTPMTPGIPRTHVPPLLSQGSWPSPASLELRPPPLHLWDLPQIRGGRSGLQAPRYGGRGQRSGDHGFV